MLRSLVGSEMCIRDRGSGIEFGPDVTAAWLSQIGCNVLIRSHECIEDGCQLTKIPSPSRSRNVSFELYTIFSASNYADGDNQAAVLTYLNLTKKPTVYRFRSTTKPPNIKMVGRNRLRLADLIFRRHHRLLRAFQAADQTKAGRLSQNMFIKVLKEGLKLDIKWSALLPSMLGEWDRRDGQVVEYNAFLNRLSTFIYTARGEAPSQEQAALSKMYDNFHLLKATFDFWDADNNGSVDLAEFSKGVNHLNKQIEDPELRLDAAELFELLDLDRSGEIDMNEFCEAFRLSRNSIVQLDEERNSTTL
eukprot:TRINITY_DN26590_c0_g1_i3.p1 TRINITY_DN26590_c0_g1~~TRINITY_DN26590_c0_g1_i3.p1  ORF type:complete len:305 (-),score=79.60 TRINITY_DN26590_c0_g1_i3:207-1121(-)